MIKRKRGARTQEIETLAPKLNLPIRIFGYLALAAAVVTIIFPICIIFVAAFKTNEEYLYTSVLELPQSFMNLQNFKTVIQTGKLLIGFKNTMILCFAGIAGSVFMGSMVAYIISRFQFRFKNMIVALFFLPVMIPSITVQIATFTLITDLHLYNTIFAGILIYLAADITQIYVFLQFVDKIPMALDESALVEGASYLKIYSQIILPQLKPAIATVMILKFINVYNDAFSPYLYMPKSSLKTMSTALMTFNMPTNSSWNVMAAGILLVMLPTLLLYLFLQKYIIAGVTDGAVK